MAVLSDNPGMNKIDPGGKDLENIQKAEAIVEGSGTIVQGSDNQVVGAGGVLVEGDVQGSINTGIQTTIQNSIVEIHERAKSAVEEAQEAKEFETKILAQGVMRIADRLKNLAEDKEDSIRSGPYRGLLEYRLADSEIFLGRRKAIEELWTCIQRGRLTVLYSAAGAGKTSLLQAGMVPRLLEGGNLPLILRPYNQNPALAVKQAFVPDLSQAYGLGSAPLREFLIQVCKILGEKHSLFILLDQFEEFFIRLRPDEQEHFIDELAICLKDETLPVNWVLAMRSEYFSELSAFEPRIYNPFGNKYLLNLLSRKEAIEVITTPLKLLDEEYEEGLVEQILDDLGGNEIAPPEIQLVCSALYQELAQENGTIITRALYEKEGYAKGILRSHLERVMQKQFNQEERRVAKRILESLVDSNKEPLILNQVELGNDPGLQGIPPQERSSILEKMVASRLLRSVEIEAGAAYTLANQYLLDEIQLDPHMQARKAAQELLLQEERANQRTPGSLISKERLAVIQPFLKDIPVTSAQQELIDKSQKKIDEQVAKEEADRLQDLEQARALAETRRRWMVTLAGGVLVSLLLLVVAIIFYNNSQVALRGQQAASTQSANNAATAEAASAQALIEKNRAEQQASISRARQLAAQSKILQIDKLIPALLLSAQGYLTDNDFETRSSLLSTVQCCSNSLVSLMSGHKDSVWDVAFSPDEKILVSSGTDGAVIVWDVATRTQIARLNNPLKPGTIYKLAFSPEDPILATADSTGSIVLYDTETWQQIGEPLRSLASSVYAIKFSDDGKLLVSGDESGLVIVWNVAQGRRVRTFFQHNARVWDVAVNTELHTVASVSRDKTLRLWDLNGWDSADPLTMDSVNVLTSVAFIPDKNQTLLVTGDTSRNVIVWNLQPWIEKRARPLQTRSQPITSNGIIWTLKPLPGERLSFLAGVENGALKKVHIEVKDIFSDTIVTTDILGISGHNTGIFRSDMALNQGLIATAGMDGLVGMWGIKDMSGIVKHPANVNSLQVLNNQDLVSSIDTNGNIFQWDYTLPGLPKRISLQSGRVHKSAVFPDGTKVVYVLDDANKNTIVVWDTQTQQVLAQSTDYLDRGKINCVAVDLSGTLIATGDGDGDVILRKLTGNKLETIGQYFSSNKETFHSLAFTPDSKTLVGGTLYVWDIEPKFKLRYEQLQGTGGFARSVAINPADPNELAVGSENGVLTIWDLRQRIAKHFIRLGTYRINSIAYSPDGTLLAVAVESTNMIYLYDVKTGQRYGRYFREHDSRINTVAFSPDGSALFSASSDGTIITHDLRIDKWLERACQIANRNLTLDEWRQYVGKVDYAQTCPGLP